MRFSSERLASLVFYPSPGFEITFFSFFESFFFSFELIKINIEPV
jgi:hypothetical protein